MARAVPRNTWKSVHDAWNGFHSIPICDEDKHLTTFQSPIGRLRYARAPQGFLSSGDAYNKRFDCLLMDFRDKERCVDDTVYWDEDLENHWWRTIEFLELMGNAGIVLNPKKFQFAKKEVHFAGFEITSTGVKPLPKYIDAIRLFPTPSSLTDVRAWFGLTNQVSHYAQLRDLVAPMRPLLKKNAQFEWTDALNEAFEKSKVQIINAIKNGVEIFDKDRITCLSTDWSKSGIGYYLMQKHCSCNSDSPGCCGDGWRITLAGSRQLNPAETRYAPVEGEMLAVVWSLEQTRYFTQGCRNLLILTDHKPLLKLLGDRTLDEIHNMRLFRLKERTMMWRFRVQHRPGKDHFVADATSRKPLIGICDDVDVDYASDIAMVNVLRDSVNKIRAITWDRVKLEMKQDSDMVDLLNLVRSGFPATRKEMPAHLAPYWGYSSIYILDDVLVCNERILIPPRLREEVLENLHAAHHGVISMTHRSQEMVIWPGITADIQRTRNMCRTCNQNAPSQAGMPAVEPIVPSMPFVSVCSDFFQLEGYHYLITVDRFSGWCDVKRAVSGTPSSGSRGLISALRQFFAAFGVPSELSSDGGPEFVADETVDFFNRWGVHHRLSSAYHPQSNGRAELGVKSMKRLLRDNIGPGGSLDTDRFLRAILIHRNTPDPISKKSPAEIIFGRQLRDTLPVFRNTNTIFDDKRVLPMWRDAWSLKERALRIRAVRSTEKLNQHSKKLPDLRHGDSVLVQNQTGPHPGKWDRTGVVVECRPHDQYTVKIDATGRLTLRNRRYLRQITPTGRDTLLGIAPSSPSDVTDTISTPVSKPYSIVHDVPEPILHDVPAVIPDVESIAPVCARTFDPVVERSLDDTGTAPTNESPIVRRSTRHKNQTRVYDATSGEYVVPESY